MPPKKDRNGKKVQAKKDPKTAEKVAQKKNDFFPGGTAGNREKNGKKDQTKPDIFACMDRKGIT